MGALWPLASIDLEIDGLPTASLRQVTHLLPQTQSTAQQSAGAMAPAARRWDFTSGGSGASSSVSAGSSVINVVVEPPFGYMQRGAGGQVVESAAAGKASIEELNKEKAMKQRVGAYSSDSFQIIRPPFRPFRQSPRGV